MLEIESPMKHYLVDGHEPSLLESLQRVAPLLRGELLPPELVLSRVLRGALQLLLRPLWQSDARISSYELRACSDDPTLSSISLSVRANVVVCAVA